MGITVVDWERVQTEQARALDDLRRLGSEVGPDQVLVIADEVLTCKLAQQRFNELRTARAIITTVTWNLYVLTNIIVHRSIIRLNGCPAT
jgi:hypothetical protein